MPIEGSHAWAAWMVRILPAGRCMEAYWGAELYALPERVLPAVLRHLLFFLLITPPPPRSTLFPYTTLFRSAGIDVDDVESRAARLARRFRLPGEQRADVARVHGPRPLGTHEIDMRGHPRRSGRGQGRDA